LSKRPSTRHSSEGDEGGDPHKDSFSSLLDLNKRKGGKKGQPPFPPILP